GRDCDVQLAERIAGSVVELHASRQPSASRDGERDEQMPQCDERATQAASAQASKSDARRSGEHAHTDFFSALWHGAIVQRLAARVSRTAWLRWR
ncbi:hypothetical protein DIE06_37145, partial [Burkholderia sp. Bp8998]